MTDPMQLMRMLQFADSAFPIGSFAFSDGLETAVSEGLVADARKRSPTIPTQSSAARRTPTP